MRNILLILLVSIGFFIHFTPVHSVVRAEIQTIADLYNSDQVESARLALQKALPATEEEKSVILYYKALLATDGNQAKGLLQQICNTYPKQPVTQKAYLELGHIQLLDRDYADALTTYRKITDPAIIEKTYWIANTQNAMGKYADAIASAELFLRSAKTNDLAEDAYFLIADAYVALNQYNNVINTLNKMKANLKEIDDEQYFRYRNGYAYEMLGNKAEALDEYKKGYEINRFSQLAYQIEDRLFILRGKKNTSVDLSFLYPYSDAPLPEIVLNNPVKGTNNTDVEIPLTPDETPKTLSRQIDKAPDKGIFLQAGRFSNKANAGKLSDKIAALGFPSQFYQATNYKDVSWVVICGPFDTNQLATDARDELKTSNIDTFIIQR